MILIVLLLCSACPALALHVSGGCLADSFPRVQLWGGHCHDPGRYVVESCGLVSDTLLCVQVGFTCVMQPVEIPWCGEWPVYRRVDADQD